MYILYGLITRTDPEHNVKQALQQMYINAVETGDEHRHYAIETLDALQKVKLFSRDTRLLLQVGFYLLCVVSAIESQSS